VNHLQEIINSGRAAFLPLHEFPLNRLLHLQAHSSFRLRHALSRADFSVSCWSARSRWQGWGFPPRRSVTWTTRCGSQTLTVQCGEAAVMAGCEFYTRVQEHMV